ncbi:unnamed protein product [Zymoseptoria tritici ST99CH_1A5]|uniref:Uncharacterized protein n=1 Tax=Zymoseptoria tritici ST99CH_1A5 TaxID=1276529 RepID=A0A1Y6L7X1_ZYMTR|nr:unnamed protein product [Zymoseptoria tritici ST99CH_1A5]
MHLSTTTPLMALVALFSFATMALGAAVPEAHANIGNKAPPPDCDYEGACDIDTSVFIPNFLPGLRAIIDLHARPADRAFIHFWLSTARRATRQSALIGRGNFGRVAIDRYFPPRFF